MRANWNFDSHVSAATPSRWDLEEKRRGTSKDRIRTFLAAQPEALALRVRLAEQTVELGKSLCCCCL